MSHVISIVLIQDDGSLKLVLVDIGVTAAAITEFFPAASITNVRVGYLHPNDEAYISLTVRGWNGLL